MTPARMTPHDVAARRLAGPAGELIDVRTPAEFVAAHAVGARNVPLSGFGPAAVPAGGPVYVICHTGGRADRAGATLAAAGRADVFTVAGGTVAWAAAGLPVVRGTATMSLERQVRIAAGLLVVAGVGLALAVHPGFVGVSAFVGAGLVFAGVTGTCTMGLALARTPWNRIPAPRPEPTSCAASP